MALKDTELQELVSYMGIDVEKIESLDKAKDQISNDYLRKSLIKDSDELKQAIGGALGSISVSVKRFFKENGVELSGDEIKDKKVEDIISLGEKKLKDIYSSKIKEIQESASSKPSEREKEWEEKYNKLNSKHSETLGLIDNLKLDSETKVKAAMKEIQNYKVNDYKKRAFGAVKFNEDARKDDLRMTGFNSYIDGKYDIDLDETDTPFIKSKETGQRIPDPKKHGSFLGLEDVLNMEAEQKNLTEKVGDNQKKTTFVKPASPVAPVDNSVPKQNRRVTYSDRTGK